MDNTTTNVQGWISVKERLPEDDNQFCVFAQWYPNWSRWVNSESMTWAEIKRSREYDLKNSYTHWQPLANNPYPEGLTVSEGLIDHGV